MYNFILRVFDIQLFRFAVVGIINLSITYLFFYFFILLNYNYFVSATIGYVAGMINSYVLNKMWTFNVIVTDINQIKRFMIVYCSSYFVNIFLLYILIETINLTAECSEIISIIIAACGNYIGLKYYGFKDFSK